MWAGFLSSLLLVTVAEFGDKTFFYPLDFGDAPPTPLGFSGDMAGFSDDEPASGRNRASAF